MKAPAFWWSPGASVPATLLAPAAGLYGMAARRRMARTEPAALPVPVVCIGNLVVGGAGKTPVALDIGARLAACGRQPHFLSRGYGGKLAGPLRVDPARHSSAEVGDEPLLLAQVAPSWIARDRAAGGRAAADAGAGVIVMDDGFQNPALGKDLSLVVVDGRRGFGNGRVLPAGPLREPAASGLKRADAVVVMGEGGGAASEATRLAAGEDLPVLRARVTPGPEVTELIGRPLLAFAGLGDPGKFFATLAAAGCRVAERREFADHHPYSRRDLETLAADAARGGCLLVTTAKDAVRIPADLRGTVRVLTIRVEWEDEEALNRLLEPIIQVSP